MQWDPVEKLGFRLKTGVTVYDPKAMKNFAKIFPQTEYANSAEDAAAKSDAVLIDYSGKIVADVRRIEKATKGAGIYEDACR